MMPELAAAPPAVPEEPPSVLLAAIEAVTDPQVQAALEALVDALLGDN